MARIVRHISTVLLAIIMCGCGSETNLFNYATSDAEKAAFDALLASGQAAYDRNDLQVALSFSERAFEQNPGSERAALLYGYVNLSLAKADPFSLSKSLSKIDAGGTAPSGSGEASLQGNADQGAGDTLTKLKGALGLSRADILLLGELDTEDPSIPLLVPKCVEEVRELVSTLTYVDRAIRAACPFIEEHVRNREDVRQDCESSETRHFPYKSHFLWAFAHLSEALAFHSVLTFGDADPTGEKSNLQLRVEKLKDRQVTSPTEIIQFTSEVEALERTVNAILPVGGACSLESPTSQLLQTLNDLLAVNVAFAQIPQIPDKIKGSITKAMEKITNLQGGEGGDPRLAQTKALKGDLTKKLAGPLAQKIDALEDETGAPLSEEETAKLCDSFDSIASGGQTKPAACTESP